MPVSAIEWRIFLISVSIATVYVGLVIIRPIPGVLLTIGMVLFIGIMELLVGIIGFPVISWERSFSMLPHLAILLVFAFFIAFDVRSVQGRAWGFLVLVLLALLPVGIRFFGPFIWKPKPKEAEE